jgi:hypothetical protein
MACGVPLLGSGGVQAQRSESSIAWARLGNDKAESVSGPEGSSGAKIFLVLYPFTNKIWAANDTKIATLASHEVGQRDAI